MLKEIKERRSVRKYTDIPVTKEQVEDLLHAAMNAPSACNSQNWKFIATLKREDLDTIANMPAHYSMAKDASAAIIAMGEPGVEFGQFFEVNVAAAIENILLEATHLGLGAVWCAIHPIKERVECMRKAFDIDEKYVPVAVIVIGNPKEIPHKEDQYDDTKVIWRL